MLPTTTLTVGRQLHGFEIEAVTPVPGIRAVAVRATHRKSGARLLHIHNTDTENCFAVTFPTPPPDDTGLPHILEHSVLGGSKKFPVREPFFEMVKMSVATFINAMTHQAFTVYPIATNVKKDFFNLAEVYLDAVFHPELKEDTFRREGHHFRLEDNADLASPLRISGIVYNEMKGAYSSPESLMWELACRGLFPGTPLGRNSGGDPDHIPDLTYEQFRGFHETLYHPCNALIFIYGDIPTEEHLRFLAPALGAFDRRPVNIALPRSRRWPGSRRLEKEYPIGTTEDTAARAFFTLNWVVGDALDAACVTDWEVLSKILLGNDAAPLKKALIDSRLGANVFFAGTWASAYEQEFHVGLKGSEPDRADQFETLVLDTLQRIAAGPITRERVEAAFQQLAYDHLEVKTLFPLHLLFAVDQSWPYGGDPLTFLRMSDHLEACRQRYAADNEMFNRLIQEALLNNPHRLRVVLRPDREAQARADAAFTQRMARERAKLTADQLAAVARAAAELEAAQSVPNSPEALAKLPQLGVSDLPAKPRHIPTTVARVAGIDVLRNDVFANGVNYFEFDVDIAGLPSALYAWLPRFAEAVNKMGAAGQSFIRIAERRAACTGGLSCYTPVLRHATDPTRSLRRVRLRMKTLDGQAENALRLLGDLIFAVDPRDRDRLRDVMTQARAWYRTTLVNDGLSTARRQAARGLSPEGALQHQFVSPDALRLVEDLTGHFDANAERLIRNIEQIRDFLPVRSRWTVSFTGSDTVFRTLTRILEEWAAPMGNERVVDAPPPFQPFVSPPREGLAGPMKIAHCAKVMPAPHLGHPDVPLFRLGAYLARFDYLLPEVRLKGNAYGAGAGHDDALGTFVLYSHSDPHIVETLQVFDRLRDYIAGQNRTQSDIDRAIIGSAKEAEKPIRPEEATGLALNRHLRGDTNELREQRYAATLRATPRLVKETLLGVLEANEPRAAICVVSSREKLVEANQALGAHALTVADMLT
jgi:hypothetical protein